MSAVFAFNLPSTAVFTLFQVGSGRVIELHESGETTTTDFRSLDDVDERSNNNCNDRETGEELHWIIQEGMEKKDFIRKVKWGISKNTKKKKKRKEEKKEREKREGKKKKW